MLLSLVPVLVGGYEGGDLNDLLGFGGTQSLKGRERHVLAPTDLDHVVLAVEVGFEPQKQGLCRVEHGAGGAVQRG